MEKLQSGYADDVSRLNKTRVAENWDIPSNLDEAERKLRELLRKAQASGLHVSIAGARHTMGGQTIYPTSRKTPGFSYGDISDTLLSVR